MNQAVHVLFARVAACVFSADQKSGRGKHQRENQLKNAGPQRPKSTGARIRVKSRRQRKSARAARPGARNKTKNPTA
jgi:hypothetical protein